MNRISRNLKLFEMSPLLMVILSLMILCINGTDMPEQFGTIGDRELRSPHPHYALRRLDCQVFCKKTGFSGYVGGCQCGFTLFANKRSDNGNIGFFPNRGNYLYGARYGRNVPNGPYPKLAHSTMDNVFRFTGLGNPLRNRITFGHL